MNVSGHPKGIVCLDRVAVVALGVSSSYSVVFLKPQQEMAQWTRELGGESLSKSVNF